MNEVRKVAFRVTRKNPDHGLDEIVPIYEDECDKSFPIKSLLGRIVQWHDYDSCPESTDNS